MTVITVLIVTLTIISILLKDLIINSINTIYYNNKRPRAQPLTIADAQALRTQKLQSLSALLREVKEME